MVEITIQKAMKIRKNIKDFISTSQVQLYSKKPCSVRDCDPGEFPDLEKETKTAQNTKFVVYNKMTANDFIEKIFSAMKDLEKLNSAIELANQKQHLLLIQENASKSKIAALERIMKDAYLDKADKLTKQKRDVRTKDGEWVEETYWRVSVELVSLDLEGMLKEEKKALNKFRDEISYLDATTKIEVDISEDWL